MALIVETGTGSSSAESFASVAQADTRLALFGNTAWGSLATAAKEQALRRATAYMEQAFRTRWRGTRLLRDQALSWPRYGVEVDGWTVLSTIVPDDIADACIDLAAKASLAELNADLTRAVVREKVGPLETEYSQYSAETVRYVAIDMAMAPYLRSGGATVRLERT